MGQPASVQQPRQPGYEDSRRFQKIIQIKIQDHYIGVEAQSGFVQDGQFPIGPQAFNGPIDGFPVFPLGPGQVFQEAHEGPFLVHSLTEGNGVTQEQQALSLFGADFRVAVAQGIGLIDQGDFRAPGVIFDHQFAERGMPVTPFRGDGKGLFLRSVRCPGAAFSRKETFWGGAEKAGRRSPPGPPPLNSFRG